MPIFKQLAEVEKPADPDRYILIEVIHEPAIGKQYTVTGKGLDRDRQPPGSFSSHTLGRCTRTGSGIGQDRERADHLLEQRHYPYRDVSSQRRFEGTLATIGRRSR